MGSKLTLEEFVRLKDIFEQELKFRTMPRPNEVAHIGDLVAIKGVDEHGDPQRVLGVLIEIIKTKE